LGDGDVEQVEDDELGVAGGEGVGPEGVGRAATRAWTISRRSGLQGDVGEFGEG
jgi:hypothetical protein